MTKYLLVKYDDEISIFYGFESDESLKELNEELSAALIKLGSCEECYVKFPFHGKIISYGNWFPYGEFFKYSICRLDDFWQGALSRSDG